MTLADIEKIPGEILLPKHVASILQCDQYTINLQAKLCPEKLGFPVILMKNRVKIPKQAFLKFMRGEL